MAHARVGDQPCAGNGPCGRPAAFGPDDRVLLAVDDKHGHPQARQRAAPVTGSDDRRALADGVFFGAAGTLEGSAADVPDGRLVERVSRRSDRLLQRDRCFRSLIWIGDRGSGLPREARIAAIVGILAMREEGVDMIEVSVRTRDGYPMASA